MNTDNTLRTDCAALAALVDRMSPAPVRPAGLPERLDAAQPGDVLVLIDAGQTPARRRLATVEAIDGGAILVEGALYGPHGFRCDALDAGRLSDDFVQPCDDWSWPGWSGALALEL